MMSGTEAIVAEDATEKQRTPGAVTLSWWRRLHPDASGRGGDRGALSQLRRAATPGEVLLQPQAIVLWGEIREVLKRRPSDAETEAMAVIAGALAGVRPQEGRLSLTPFATVLGQRPDGRRPESGDRAVMSASRFGSLMRATDPEERLRYLRRAIALLGGTPFNIHDFAQDILRWSDRTRQKWIFQYYQQGAAAPKPAASASEEETRL